MSDMIMMTAEQQTGEPVAWVRFCSDGAYEGPIMDSDSRMDGCRRTSGAWTPLYDAPPRAQLLRVAEKVWRSAIHVINGFRLTEEVSGIRRDMVKMIDLAAIVDAALPGHGALTDEGSKRQAAAELELVLFAENQKRQEVEQQRDLLLSALEQITDPRALPSNGDPVVLREHARAVIAAVKGGAA